MFLAEIEMSRSDWDERCLRKMRAIEGERFILRFVNWDDADDLLEVYSDKNALPLFRSTPTSAAANPALILRSVAICRTLRCLTVWQYKARQRRRSVLIHSRLSVTGLTGWGFKKQTAVQ